VTRSDVGPESPARSDAAGNSSARSDADSEPSGARRRSLSAGAVDVGLYAATVSLWTTVATLGVGVALGWGLGGGKNLLFVVGWLAFGVVAVRLFPHKRGGDETERGTTRRSRFDAVVARFPPFRWYRDEDGRSAATPLLRQLGATIAVLAASALLEFGLGIGT